MTLVTVVYHSIQQVWFWSSDCTIWSIHFLILEIGILTYILHVTKSIRDNEYNSHMLDPQYKKSLSFFSLLLFKEWWSESHGNLLLLLFRYFLSKFSIWSLLTWKNPVDFETIFFLFNWISIKFSNTVRVFSKLIVKSHAAWLVRHFLLWVPSRRAAGEVWCNFRKSLEVPSYRVMIDVN